MAQALQDRLCPAALVLLCQYGRVGTVTKGLVAASLRLKTLNDKP